MLNKNFWFRQTPSPYHKQKSLQLSPSRETNKAKVHSERVVVFGVGRDTDENQRAYLMSRKSQRRVVHGKASNYRPPTSLSRQQTSNQASNLMLFNTNNKTSIVANDIKLKGIHARKDLSKSRNKRSMPQIDRHLMLDPENECDSFSSFLTLTVRAAPKSVQIKTRRPQTQRIVGFCASNPLQGSKMTPLEKTAPTRQKLRRDMRPWSPDKYSIGSFDAGTMNQFLATSQ